MTKLSLIAGLEPSLENLLHRCGVHSAEDLARQGSAALCLKLGRIDEDEPVEGGVPDASEVVRWIQLARHLVDGETATPPLAVVSPLAKPVVRRLEDVPEVKAVRRPAAAAPTLVLPVLPVSEAVRNEVIAKAAPVVIRPLQMPTHEVMRRPTPEPVAKESTRQQFRDFQSYEAGDAGVDPLLRKPADDEEEVDASLRRMSGDPGAAVPRLVRRGVPHPRPYFLIFCALIVLSWRLLFLAVLSGTPVVLWSAFVLGDLSQLWWFLWVIVAWIVSCVFYLFFPLRARCRVCTNQFFWSKRCMKHSKAHRIPGLGLVGSTALHALFFGWFRCMYCGTAIRIKFSVDPERSK
jgi:hypothetical protein